MNRHVSLSRTFRLHSDGSLSAWRVKPEPDQGSTGTLRNPQRRPILLVLGVMLHSSHTLALDAATLPEGGQVIDGQAHISQQGRHLSVEQESQRAIIDWQRFDIGTDASVTFNQPGRDAATLNRVVGGTRSQLYGQLSATGQVYLINGAGVLFGPSAQVNAAGVVASTLNLANDDFLAGRDRFVASSQGTGEVINQGRITVRDGTLALIGSHASNTGTLDAGHGDVVLAAGREVTLAAGANGHLQVAVDAADWSAQVSNGGLIKADGGQILLDARSTDALAAAVVSNTGTLQAQTLESRSGRILLLADTGQGGRVDVAGRLDASAPKGGNGGFVETSASHVSIAGDAQVTTAAAKGRNGNWLIDPTDFTVSTGSGNQTLSGIGADTLVNNLANGNVTLQTADGGSEAGDIHIEAGVNWTAPTTLSLIAHRNIIIGAAIAAPNGALTLDAGGTLSASAAIQVGAFTLQNGAWVQNTNDLPAFTANDFRLQNGSFLRASGGDGGATTPYLLSDIYGVQGMKDFLTSHFRLTNDIQALSTQTWNCQNASCAGFVPIGSDAAPFSGGLDGGGHVIDKLRVSVDSSSRNDDALAGLFAALGPDGHIDGVGLTDVFVSAAGGDRNYAGGLVAQNLGSITGSYATGSVIAGDSDATYNYAGGLVATNTSVVHDGQTLAGHIQGSYANANVFATGGSQTAYAGGLVGTQNNGVLVQSYAMGDVSAYDATASNYAGGLVGFNLGSVEQSYATGDATSDGGDLNFKGGLLGQSYSPDKVKDVYYAITDANGQARNSGDGYSTYGTPKTWAELTSLATFENWDIDDAGGTGKVWRLYEGRSTPLLRSFLTPLTATVDDAGRTYDGQTLTVQGTAYQLSDRSAQVDGSANFATVDTRNAGSYALTLSGLYSNQQGYDLTYAAGTYTVARRSLEASYSAANKTYDGTVQATVSGTLDRSGVISGDQVELTSSGAFLDRNAGQGKTVHVSGLLSGADAGNYEVRQASDGEVLAAILRRSLEASYSAANKTYDGTVQATVSGTLDRSGVISGDQVELTSSGAFLDRNAGQGKTVHVSGLLSGADAGNYEVRQASDGEVLAAILRRSLEASYSAANKTYDGTVQATVSGTLDRSGVISGDQVELISSGAFLDRNAGQGKTVHVSGLLSGADAGNYEVRQASDGEVLAAILRRSLEASYSAANKTYDGTVQATVSGTLDRSGVISGDQVELTSSGAFLDRNAGQDKTVRVSGLLSGADAGNYEVRQASDGEVHADILHAPLRTQANDHQITFTGSPYYPNNGYRHEGFVAGDDSGVLTGLTLGYAGSAPFAVAPGIYTIELTGPQTFGNYRLLYEPGQLVIAAAATESYPLPTDVGDMRRLVGDHLRNTQASPRHAAAESSMVPPDVPLSIEPDFIRLADPGS